LVDSGARLYASIVSSILTQGWLPDP
jgi:hypothetical protein